MDKFTCHFDVVTRHTHFCTSWKLADTCNVSCSEVELGSVAGEEGFLTTAFFFGKNVNLANEFGVRLDGAGLCKNLSSFDFVLSNTSEECTDVITSFSVVHHLVEHFDTCDSCLLRGVQRTDIERGQVLAKPGSIQPHTKFRGQVYVLNKDEGGRHTPFFNNYRPQFYFRTTDVTGIIKLPEGVEMCMPGDNVEMDVELITEIAIEEGLRFAIREGGRTVGSGVVIAINE